MRKSMFVVLVTMLFSVLIAATASAQGLVCLELQHELLGIEPILYKVSAMDMGNGNYALVGSSYTTTVTNPPKTIRRVVTGGAVLMEDGSIEVSLGTTDISDRASTETVESLAVSDVHMLLDGNLNGTFHIVNLHFPVASDSESSTISTSMEGTVSLVSCD